MDADRVYCALCYFQNYNTPTGCRKQDQLVTVAPQLAFRFQNVHRLCPVIGICLIGLECWATDAAVRLPWARALSALPASDFRTRCSCLRSSANKSLARRLGLTSPAVNSSIPVSSYDNVWLLALLCGFRMTSGKRTALDPSPAPVLTGGMTRALAASMQGQCYTRAVTFLMARHVPTHVVAFATVRWTAQPELHP